MKATYLLHSLGQSLWLDNITPELLDRGLLKQYIEEYSVTGLTSNPTIFNHAIQLPEKTLKALASHTQLDSILPADGGDCEEVLAQFVKAGIDVDALAVHLQQDGVTSFAELWNDLMSVISAKTESLRKVS